MLSGKIYQRQVLYLGEINDSQKAGWCKAIDVVDGRHGQPTQLALFPDDREAPGTPKGKLSKLEESFLQKPWEQVRAEVKVKLLAEDGELYILAGAITENHHRYRYRRVLRHLRIREYRREKSTLEWDEPMRKSP